MHLFYAMLSFAFVAAGNIYARDLCEHETSFCWANPDQKTHLQNFTITATTAAGQVNECCAACKNSTDCAHWHLRPVSSELSCFLRTSNVWRSKEKCVTDKFNTTTPTPAPAPVPPTPAPVPTPPTPAPQPAVGFRPHIIFHLADDLGHYNLGWRGNKEARTPHIDSLVQEGIILDR